MLDVADEKTVGTLARAAEGLDDSILRGVDLPVAQAMREDGMTLFPLYGSNDRKEASAAFLERRQPKWSGS